MNLPEASSTRHSARTKQHLRRIVVVDVIGLTRSASAAKRISIVVGDAARTAALGRRDVAIVSVVYLDRFLSVGSLAQF
jgi:hypothetical protein